GDTGLANLRHTRLGYLNRGISHLLRHSQRIIRCSMNGALYYGRGGVISVVGRTSHRNRTVPIEAELRTLSEYVTVNMSLFPENRIIGKVRRGLTGYGE
ncbi:MAG: hypothetical protein ACLPY4_08300, partial [Methanoregula sp.]